MQKKSLSRFLEVESKTKSWQPVARNGWIIKFSIFNETNFLITVISQYTGQVAIRYFDDEDAACLFINFVQELSAEQLMDL